MEKKKHLRIPTSQCPKFDEMEVCLLKLMGETTRLSSAKLSSSLPEKDLQRKAVLIPATKPQL